MITAVDRPYPVETQGNAKTHSNAAGERSGNRVDGQWLDGNELLGGIAVKDLRAMYSRCMGNRPAVFPNGKNEQDALLAMAMMDKAHSADFDD